MIARIIIGVVIGGAAGFACYKLIGCAGGACPLTSNPWTSTLAGILMGGLAAASFL